MVKKKYTGYAFIRRRKMPIKQQTTEFIEGYVFSRFEKYIIEALIKCGKEIHAKVRVLKSWFGLRAVKNPDIYISEDIENKLKSDLISTVSGFNTLEKSYNYDILTEPDSQYILFTLTGTFIEPVKKEMTIEEIEKELGYKIKIVGENI